MAKKTPDPVLPETAEQHVDRISRALRTERLFSNPETFEVIVDHVSNGGSPLDLCKTWDIRYSDYCRYIQSDPVRSRRYAIAGVDRQEWERQSIMREFNRIANIDIRELYRDGALLPVDQWPEAAAKAVAGIETHDLFEGTGRERQHVGEAKKIKLWDKLKALELVGKTMAMFVDKHEITGKLTLEDYVLASMKPKGETK